MSAHLLRHQTHPHPAARLRRVAAALAAMTGGLLAWAAIIPTASATTIVIPDPGGASGADPAAPGGMVQVITAGGMPGWQITLIAVGSALVAATVAVLADRARAARRAAPATTA